MPPRQIGQQPLLTRIIERIVNVGDHLMQGIATGRGAAAVNLADPDSVLGRPRMNAADNTNETGPANFGPDDPELLAHRRAAIHRGLRHLCNDREYLHLSEEDWTLRLELLNWYREQRFIVDLAEGYHDQWVQGLQNQEHDAYYTDLWTYMAGSSRAACAALSKRINPHRQPRIRLTIPPRYQPSDLPPYTATTLPPAYSVRNFR